MARKILVTGGAGFIGTHLCRRLRADGFEVRSLDLVDPAAPVAGVTYLRGDVNEGAALREALAGVEAVFHFAAVVSVPLCQEDPLGGYRTNLTSTLRLIEHARCAREDSPGSPPIRIVFSGSSAVYGLLGEAGVPLGEDRLPDAPLSYYAAQKLGSEHALRVAHRSFGLPTVCFRFFNVYGPGQPSDSPYSGVISLFAAAARAGKPVRLNGGGGQTRDFVSVHDVADACAGALALPAERCDGAPINLGSGKSITVRDLAMTIGEVAGAPLSTLDAPAREGDVPHSRAGIARARNVLDWEPRVTLRAGLEELLK